MHVLLGSDTTSHLTWCPPPPAENPCPHLGDVVTVKLSESAEGVATADAGQTAAVVAETHFQMNYATGEWKRIKKFRRVDKTFG